MTRKSTRIQQKAAASSYSPTYEGCDTSDMEDASNTPKASWRKKQKTANGSANAEGQAGRKVRGKRGLLNRLTEMPLDIMFEIFGNLSPVDLLQVSRTTKALRRVVFSRSAISFWKKAFKNLHTGLPGCPDDMSEPCYASLLFDNFCHTCPTGIGHKTEWVLRMRFCKQCIEKEFVDCDVPFYNDGSDPDSELFIKLVPNIIYRTGSRYGHTRLFHLKSMLNLKDTFQQQIAESNAEEWLKGITTKYADRRKHGGECYTWLGQRAYERYNEGERIRERRRDAIIQKLTDLGWGDEIKKMPYKSIELRKHQLVWQKKELTDRIWNNIQPKLIKFMEDRKKSRLEWEERTILQRRRPFLVKLRAAYAKTLPPNSIIPPAADLNSYQPFCNIIENTPPYEEVTLEDFDDAMEGLPEFVNQWRQTKDLELLRLMGAPVADDDPDYSPLYLATTVFKCKENMNNDHLQCFSVSYPRILLHDGACMHDEGVANVQDSYEASLYKHLKEGKWNCDDQVIFNTEGHDVAKEMVTLCGLDPDIATSQDMDALDPLLKCNSTTCSRDGAHRCMRWREAISHVLFTNSFFASSRHTFTLITDDSLRKEIKFLLEQKKLSRYHTESLYYCQRDKVNRFICVHCREKGPLFRLRRHIIKEHGKENITHADVVRDIDVDPQITCTYQYDELEQNAET